MITNDECIIKVEFGTPTDSTRTVYTVKVSLLCGKLNTELCLIEPYRNHHNYSEEHPHEHYGFYIINA